MNHNRTSTSTLWQMTLMALDYLRGRKLRTALTTLAIVFGVAMIFAVNMALPAALDAFKGSLTAGSGAVDIVVTAASGESFAPAGVLERVMAVDGVQAASGALRRQLSVPSVGAGGTLGNDTVIDMMGVDPATAPGVRPYVMSEGRFLEPADSGVAVIPAAIADLVSGLKPGATFPLVTAKGLRPFQIVGLLAESGNPDAPDVIIPLRDAQAALAQPGLVNRVDVAIEPGVDRERVNAAVQAALGERFVLNGTGAGSDVFASLEIGYAMMNLMGVLALFLGAFLIFNTFRAVILERRRDLSMMRAIGATRRQLSVMILVESLVQGVIGIALGLLLGYGMARALSAAMSAAVQAYVPGLDLDVQPTAAALFTAAGLGLVTTLLAGYFPARAAGRITPLEGLRPAPVADVRRAARWGLIVGMVVMAAAAALLVGSRSTAAAGAALFLLGMLLAAPGLVLPMVRLFSPMLSLWFAREGDLARGNLVREPGRAAITASTLMVGLASLIMIVGLVHSFDRFVTDMSNRSFASDILVVPPALGVYTNVVGADETLARTLRALPDVSLVTGLRYASGRSGAQALQVMGIDPTLYPQVAGMDFNEGGAEDAFSALAQGRAAIVTSLAALDLGVKVGDELPLDTPTGVHGYRVVAIANDLLTMKIDAIYVSQENLASDFNKREDVFLMVNLTSGADKDAALERVREALEAYPQFTASIASEYRETLAATTSAALNLFYAIAVLILIPAALGLLNTLTMNILERRREIGIVRAVGASKAQVRRIVTAEALLLGLFGAACGVLVGVAMSYGFITAFGTVGWRLPYAFPIAGIIAAVVIGVLLAMFASVLPARNAAGLDIVRALQYE